jgi:nicotinate-nucleotide adenylyltransferase
MTERRRIGVFGGAFDPPHIGHLVVAQDVLERLNLDRLIVVPTARPVHRETALPGRLRLELTESAFADADRIDVSGIEFEGDRPSYMVETLETLCRREVAADLWLIIGSDQYTVFETWKEPERILELAQLAVMQRGEDVIKPDPRFPYEAVDVTRIDVSGEAIRRRIALGQSIRYLVPESVFATLESNLEHVTGPIEAC